MKKNVLSVLVTVLSASAIIAQEAKENKVDQGSGFNHWSVDLNVGFTKPVAPFSSGRYTETFGNIKGDFGVRYMFNNKAGLKLDFGYDPYKVEGTIKETKGAYHRINLQGVINLGRVLNFEDWTGRLGLLAHGGGGYAWISNDGVDRNDEMINLIGGLTGQIRLSNRVSFNVDMSAIPNFKQSRTFDGVNSTSISQRRFYNGGLLNLTAGLSIYLGKNVKHADWYVAAVEENRQAEEKVAALENKLNDLESKVIDTDKDGIADAYDEEKDSAAGAMVDSKGRSIDLNNNGIADSTDKALAAQAATIKNNNTTSTTPTTTTTTNTTTIGQMASAVDAAKLINDGYVAAYFNLGDARPNNNSAEGIGFILTFLRNNPSASVDIIGNTDETGTVEFNNKLAAQRAQNVKTILMKAGVSASRLNIVAKGEDKSVDVNSADARRLVRKVIFRVK